ncbi:MAG: endonuclease domain-containing protein [Pseudonocardiaceae bacterium]
MAAGLLTKGQLRGNRFHRLFPDIYLARDIAPTLATRSRGAHLLIAGYGALAGYSAAELLGARIAPRDADAEIVVPGGEFRECRGLRVHREQLADDEVETVSGLVVTSAIRTAYDLARWSTQVEGVVAADAMGQIGRFGSAALLGMAARYPGARWRSRVPLVAELMDPRAESAMETRCRVSLMLRGLPRLELQYQVRDEVGAHVARLDMAYPAAMVGVEFDGEHHQDAPTFRADLVRHNRLAALGWTVLRASATDVLRNPDAFAAQVRALLHQRAASGCGGLVSQSASHPDRRDRHRLVRELPIMAFRPAHEE